MSRSNNHLSVFNDSINSNGRNSSLSNHLTQAPETASVLSTYTPEKPLAKRSGASCCAFWKSSRKSIDRSDRNFFINDYERNLQERKYTSNYLRTTKYTLWNFLPLSLIYQFKREANIYFLIQAILNSIPAVSAMNPISAYLPLAIVLGVSMLREGLEDYSRYKSDKITNNQPIKLVKDGKVVECLAKDIVVGDIILIQEDEFFPADLVLLATSQENASCLVRTSSLDGESAPKIKKVAKGSDWVIPSGGKEFRPDEFLCTGKCKIEGPNSNLYAFDGQMVLSKKTFNLGYEQILLKGTQLMNTDWVIGFVAYTGKETRIMMNSQVGNLKQSDVEKMMNKFTVTIVTYLLVLTLALAIIGGFWHSEASAVSETTILKDDKTMVHVDADAGQPVHFYIEFNYGSFAEGFFTFTRYFQLLSLLLPTSLFVSVEILKAIIASLVESDIMLMSKKRAQETSVRNMSIIEDLGMVHYVFADKTGTLTCNKMEFHSMCIGATEFGPKAPRKDTIQRRQSIKEEQEDKEVLDFDFEKFETYIQGRMDEHLQEFQLCLRSENENMSLPIMSMPDLMNEFMTAMSLNHACIRVLKNKQQKDSEKEWKKEMIYQGTSPDEITLVKFAQSCGYEFRRASDHEAKLRVPPRKSLANQTNVEESKTFIEQESHSNMLNFGTHHGLISNPSETSFESSMMAFDRSFLMRHPKHPDDQIYQILSRMDFTSERRRMSILVRDQRDQHLKLYVKGADDVIRERLQKGTQDPLIVSSVENFVRESSRKGLRTLLFAMKILDEDEVQQFQEELNTLHEMKVRNKKLEEEHYSKLESNLTLLGATAVEDKLQDEVPEVIEDLHQADVKVWMLTGDKFETAENIARSCQLIKSDFEVFRLKDAKDVKTYCSSEFVEQNENLMTSQKKRAMIVENTALSLITERDDFEMNFIRVSKTCEAVICCRLRPGQKADVVSMIKKDDKCAITLAIGDGANDVSMIKEAHVGVGIYGNEGLRAVQASDFAIPEFKKLHRLMFVHGRARYVSITKFVLYFFYKNAVLTLPQFFFAYFSGYSGMTCFDDFYIQLYNTIFTAVPPCCLAIVFWDIHADLDGQAYERLLPKLYFRGQMRKNFNIKLFTLSQCQALFDAAVIFFINFQPIGFFGDAAITSQKYGYPNDMWQASVTSFTALMFVVHFNLFTRVKYITWLHFLSIFGLSLAPYFIYMWISNFLSADVSQTQYSVIEVHKTLIFYMKIACCVALTFLVDYAIDCWKILVKENPTDYLRILISKGLDVEQKQKQNYFNALVEREEAQARIKLSQQRQLAHLKKIQMREKLTQVHNKRLKNGIVPIGTDVGGKHVQNKESFDIDSSNKVTPPNDNNMIVLADSLRALDSATSNNQAYQGTLVLSQPHERAVGSFQNTKKATKMKQSSAYGTVREALDNELDKESSGQSSSVYFQKDTQKLLMAGSSIRVSPSNQTQAQHLKQHRQRFNDVIQESEDSLYEPPNDEQILDDSPIGHAQLLKNTNPDKGYAHDWNSINVDRDPPQSMSVTAQKPPSRIKKQSPAWPSKGKVLVNTIITEEPIQMQDKFENEGAMTPNKSLITSIQYERGMVIVAETDTELEGKKSLGSLEVD